MILVFSCVYNYINLYWTNHHGVTQWDCFWVWSNHFAKSGVSELGYFHIISIFPSQKSQLRLVFVGFYTYVESGSKSMVLQRSFDFADSEQLIWTNTCDDSFNYQYKRVRVKIIRDKLWFIVPWMLPPQPYLHPKIGPLQQIEHIDRLMLKYTLTCSCSPDHHILVVPQHLQHWPIEWSLQDTVA